MVGVLVLEIVALVLLLALIGLTATLALKPLPSRFTLRIEHRHLAVEGEEGERGGASNSIPPPPDKVIEFCARESEQWAREDLMRRAQQLYAEYGDWDVVLTQLELDAGDGSS